MKAACDGNLRKSVIVFLFLLVAPIAASALKYLLGDRSVDWQTADRSSAGLLPPPAEYPDALVRIYAARTVRWRGIFAVHCWIVIKERNAPRHTRYDYTAWGEPIHPDTVSSLMTTLIKAHNDKHPGNALPHARHA